MTAPPVPPAEDEPQTADAPPDDGAELAEQLEDAGRRLAGSIEGVLGELGDFLVDAVRTWGVVVLRPWSAGRRLLDDAEAKGGRYVGPSAFLVVSSVVVALLTGGSGETQGVGAETKAVLEAALKAASGEAEAAGYLLNALLSAALLYSFARIASVLGPRALRDPVQRLTTWALSVSMLGVAVFWLVLTVGGEDADWAYLLVLWSIAVAPGFALARWTWVQAIPLRRLRALSAFAFVWVFVGVWGTAHVALEEAKAAADPEPVWLFDKVEEVGGGQWTVTGRFYNDSAKPWRHCDYSLCGIGSSGEECRSATLVDPPSGWLVPQEAVELTLKMELPYEPQATTVCCDHNPERCLRGQWSVP